MPKGRPGHMLGLSNSRHRSLGEERAKAHSLSAPLSISLLPPPSALSRLPECCLSGRAPSLVPGHVQGQELPCQTALCQVRVLVPPHTINHSQSTPVLYVFLFAGRMERGGGVIWNMKKEAVLKTSTHQALTHSQGRFRRARASGKTWYSEQVFAKVQWAALCMGVLWRVPRMTSAPLRSSHQLPEARDPTHS